MGCIVGSLLTKPEPDVVLMRFYMQIKPWGFWKPVLRMARKYYPDFEPNRRLPRDLFNIVVGVAWQVCLVLTPMSLVTQQYHLFIGVISGVVVTSLILKFTWWNNLDEASRETLPEDFEQRVVAVLAPPAGKGPGGLSAQKATVI